MTDPHDTPIATTAFTFQGRTFSDYIEFLEFVDNDVSINMTNEEKILEFQKELERRKSTPSKGGGNVDDEFVAGEPGGDIDNAAIRLEYESYEVGHATPRIHTTNVNESLLPPSTEHLHIDEEFQPNENSIPLPTIESAGVENKLPKETEEQQKRVEVQKSGQEAWQQEQIELQRKQELQNQQELQRQQELKIQEAQRQLELQKQQELHRQQVLQKQETQRQLELQKQQESKRVEQHKQELQKQQEIQRRQEQQAEIQKQLQRKQYQDILTQSNQMPPPSKPQPAKQEEPIVFDKAQVIGTLI